MILFILGAIVGALAFYLICRTKLQQADTVPSLREQIIQNQSKFLAEKQILEYKIQNLEALEQKFSTTFNALASDALRNNNHVFLDLAQSVLREQKEKDHGDLDKKHAAVAELLMPIRLDLEHFNKHLHELEKSREGAYSGLIDQIKHLSTSQAKLEQEASNLSRIFRDPNVKGQWGELHLRRAVEAAGMVAYIDFEEQATTSDSDDKRQRPDMVIKLPNNRRIVVDAKFPGVQKYLEAIQLTSEDERKQKMGIYVQQLKECMQKLSQKQYYAQFDFTPEFVILFLPSEALLSAALQEDPTLIEYGSQENVMVATPTTLIALLKTVAYGWKQEQLTREARLVYTLGNSLHERLVLFYGYFGELRSQLSKSVDAYNKITSSLETRLLPVARKFHALYETEESAMNYPEPIEKSLKQMRGEEEVSTAVQ